MIATRVPYQLPHSVNGNTCRGAFSTDVPLFVTLATLECLAPTAIPLQTNMPRPDHFSFLGNEYVAARTMRGIAWGTSENGAGRHCHCLLVIVVNIVPAIFTILVLSLLAMVAACVCVGM